MDKRSKFFWPSVVTLVIWGAIFILVLFASAGCFIEKPYVTVRPAGITNELSWFTDGPNLVITVHNPTDREIKVLLYCANSFNNPGFPLTLPPKSEWNGFGQVMNREVHAAPCWLTLQ